MLDAGWGYRANVDREAAEALQPQLREMETRLTSALGEVCELPPPAKLNTGELIRVEETLAACDGDRQGGRVSSKETSRQSRSEGPRRSRLPALGRPSPCLTPILLLPAVWRRATSGT